MAASMTLTDIPFGLVEQLRTGTVSATYPEYRGEYGARVAELRGELQSLPDALIIVTSTLRDFPAYIDTIRSAIDVQAQHDVIAENNLSMTVTNEIARCSSSLTGALGQAAPWGIAFGLGTAAAQCVAAVNAIDSATAAYEAQLDASEAQARGILAQGRMGFGQRMDALALAESQLIQGFSRVNSLLAQLDLLRRAASRDVAVMNFLDTDATGREYHTNTVMRRRLNTLRIRYQRALDNAIRQSWLARVAVEQRIGVDLNDLTDDMTLVEAPSTWADTVCGMHGIDYAAIREATEGDSDDYADDFVGDYVTNLENFVQSYPIDYPFENGADVAVVSLRDELLDATEQCEQESPNLLTWSILPTSTPWEGPCAEDERCMVATWIQGTPFRTIVEPTGWERTRELGPGEAFELASICSLEAPAVCNASGVFGQPVSLDAGSYLVSWYERLPAGLLTTAIETDCDTECTATCAGDPACVTSCRAECEHDECAMIAAGAPQLEVVATGPSPTVTTPSYLSALQDLWVDACNWRRASVRLEVTEDQEVFVGFRVVVAPADPTASIVRVWSGPQVERLSFDEAMVASVPPSEYHPTDHDRMALVSGCPDVDGSGFRSEQYWTHGCTWVCPEGIGEVCSATASRAQLRCYRETRFHVSQRDIDLGRRLQHSGFAEGNFNYRYDWLALNLVGVGARDCAGAENPDACYAQGALQYTLTHDGPFWVRNYTGGNYSAPIFDGAIEHAPILAADRRVTDPISSGDESLLSGDVMRTEFRGRPLAGTYRLRIWDHPALQWSNVEDVQFVLRYGYWTRFSH
jgi:hypothetical protein